MITRRNGRVYRRANVGRTRPEYEAAESISVADGKLECAPRRMPKVSRPARVTSSTRAPSLAAIRAAPTTQVAGCEGN